MDPVFDARPLQPSLGKKLSFRTHSDDKYIEQINVVKFEGSEPEREQFSTKAEDVFFRHEGVSFRIGKVTRIKEDGVLNFTPDPDIASLLQKFDPKVHGWEGDVLIWHLMRPQAEKKAFMPHR